jgi:hypothetical protein
MAREKPSHLKLPTMAVSYQASIVLTGLGGMALLFKSVTAQRVSGLTLERLSEIVLRL